MNRGTMMMLAIAGMAMGGMASAGESVVVADNGRRDGDISPDPYGKGRTCVERSTYGPGTSARKRWKKRRGASQAHR